MNLDPDNPRAHQPQGGVRLNIYSPGRFAFIPPVGNVFLSEYVVVIPLPDEVPPSWWAIERGLTKSQLTCAR